MFPESTLAATQRSFSRRWFMKDCGLGLGSVALASMLGEARAAAPVISPQAPKPPPFPAKAKNVIFLFMGGAPSHLDLFDRKPELIRMDGKTPPAVLLKGYRSAFIRPENKLLGSKFKFRHFGKCGMEMAEILPHIGSCADEIALIRSMHTAAFEMAFRMQDVAPEVTDISLEPQSIRDLYGAEPGKRSFANNCLLARRLVERGVRFVELFHESWDQHGNLTKDLEKNCKDVDQACAALIQDLKQRGLLDETLIVWGGEFGRTPMVQGGNDGRDHHPNAFTMWLAGGGVKGGTQLGITDELGFNAVEDKVHVHDLNATILHLLGFDHTKLTYRSQGRDFRLTDVHGKVVTKVLG